MATRSKQHDDQPGTALSAVSPADLAVTYGWSAEAFEIIRDQVCPEASDMELAYFFAVAGRYQLDPLKNQIYLVPRRKKIGNDWVQVKVPQLAIDGYRLLAERTGLYRGSVGPFWCGADGVWHDIWIDEDLPAAAKAGVLRADCAEPIWGKALYRSFVDEKSPRWKDDPEGQLALCAERQAIRRAFPQLGDLESAFDRPADEAGAVPYTPLRLLPDETPPPKRLSCETDRTRSNGDVVTVLMARANDLPFDQWWQAVEQAVQIGDLKYDGTGYAAVCDKRAAILLTKYPEALALYRDGAKLRRLKLDTVAERNTMRQVCSDWCDRVQRADGWHVCLGDLREELARRLTAAKVAAENTTPAPDAWGGDDDDNTIDAQFTADDEAAMRAAELDGDE